ncbi:hypothetical protein [Rhodoferax sp. U11-2br]|nr:hypothetical protein [Rhodoferax sp. U11-2br]
MNFAILSFDGFRENATADDSARCSVAGGFSAGDGALLMSRVCL